MFPLILATFYLIEGKKKKKPTQIQILLFNHHACAQCLYLMPRLL